MAADCGPPRGIIIFPAIERNNFSSSEPALVPFVHGCDTAPFSSESGGRNQRVSSSRTCLPRGEKCLLEEERTNERTARNVRGEVVRSVFSGRYHR